ncbi:MAG: IMP dehydrogenase [Nanoarchaeota archaeon]
MVIKSNSKSDAGRRSAEFFKWHKENYYSLTFDDVSLKTGYSQVSPKDVELNTKITKNVTAKMPILSSAMDTVTEYELAIAIAKEGGMGFIHKNMPVETQAWQISKVKNHLNGVTGLIKKPICMQEDKTLQELDDYRKEKGFGFSSFLVVDNEKKLKGIITNKHFLFSDYDKKLSEVMEKNLITAPIDTGKEEALEIIRKNRKKVLPLVDSDGVVRGMYAYKDLQAIENKETVHYNMDEQGNLRVGASISDNLGEENLERIKELVKRGPDVILVDSAHGDTSNMLKMIEYMNNNYPGIELMVGNISEPESAKRLLEAGKIDGIKVGQGPGSICSTRKVAGIGCPQLSAVFEITELAREYGVPVCADGGIKYSGDIVKAIGAGAHCVMLGNLLAGTKESPGKQVWIDSKLCKTYRGMGSVAAMKESKASRERYRQEEAKEPVPEGVESAVPYKGTVAQQVHMLLGGVRNGFGYVGARDVETLIENADFRRVTLSGANESMPHSVQITTRPPNL